MRVFAVGPLLLLLQWSTLTCNAFQTQGASSCSLDRPSASFRRLASHPAVDSETESSTVVSLGSEAAYREALASAPAEELVVVKFYAPWCRACRGLEPKYKRISAEYVGKDVKFFEMSHKEITAEEEGTAFLASLEVNVLPLIHFYAGGKRVEAFPCGPRKIELLRENLERWSGFSEKEAIEPPKKAVVVEEDATTAASDAAGRSPSDQRLVEEPDQPGPPASNARVVDDRRRLRTQDDRDRAKATEIMTSIPIFANLTRSQLSALVQGARLARYSPGDFMIQQGEIGRRFFVMLEGESDVYQKSGEEGPGLGTRINSLSAGSYFGERTLITNEPRVVTIVPSTAVKALTVERSALASADRALFGEGRLAEILQGSENFLWGYEQKNNKNLVTQVGDDNQADLKQVLTASSETTDLSLMQRLRLVRSVVKAFDQAAARSPKWGDAAEISYRAGLVAQLTPYQRAEFEQIFSIIDRDGDGAITVNDLAGLMASVGRAPADDELRTMISKANPEVEENDAITSADFLALMAQAEFSAMFLEAFSLLDPQGHGWVESELLWQMMKTLVPQRSAKGKATLAGSKIEELVDIFGVNDGHIDYQAFVKIMMSNGSIQAN